MGDVDQVKRFGEHRNGFGFLRLLFASLVIVSHTPELIDGNRSREILTRIFGTISFGDLAVDCFFIVSGYLITASFCKNPSIGRFGLKRVARIYPGFIVCWLICLLVVSPMGGGNVAFSMSLAARSLVRIAALQGVVLTDAFQGAHFQILNGSIWTIAYEFRCYILAGLLGTCGAFRRPALIAGMSATLMLLFKIVPSPTWDHLGSNHLLTNATGLPISTCRLTAIFLAGSAFYLFREKIIYSGGRAMIAAALLIGCLFVPYLAEPALASCGAYLIFWFADWAGSKLISNINNKNDVSYGLYLYAWPIEKLLIMAWPEVSIGAAILITFAASYVLGCLSWLTIEKPALRLLAR